MKLIDKEKELNYLVGYLYGTISAISDSQNVSRDIHIICEQALKKYNITIKKLYK